MQEEIKIAAFREALDSEPQAELTELPSGLASRLSQGVKTRLARARAGSQTKKSIFTQESSPAAYFDEETRKAKLKQMDDLGKMAFGDGEATRKKSKADLIGQMKAQKKGYFDHNDYGGILGAKLAALKSLQFQEKGAINKGYVGSFPYFAPDLPYLAPAKGASDADKLLLWLFTQNKANHEVLEADKEKLSQIHSLGKIDDDYEQYARKANEHLVYGDKTPAYSVPDINPRLFKERYQPIQEEEPYLSPRPDQLITADRVKDGKTITQNVYGDQANYHRRDRLEVKSDVKGQDDDVRQTGRIVPYFPREWNKKANVMFNEEFYLQPESAYSQKQVSGGRPTSGKHYSRHFKDDQIALFLHKATQPPDGAEVDGGDAKSMLADHLDNAKKISDLMDKLKKYLNGGQIELPSPVISQPPVIQESTQMDSDSTPIASGAGAPIIEMPEVEDDGTVQFSDGEQGPPQDTIQSERLPLLKPALSVPDLTQSKPKIQRPPWNYANQEMRGPPLLMKVELDLPKPQPEFKFRKCLLHTEADDHQSEECCSDGVHHRFHSHGKQRKQKSLQTRLKMLNTNQKVTSIGLPDMEFALTPVPGPVKPGNIYQTTKLVTDEAYFAKLKQFDQRVKEGAVARKGRYVEGVFVDCNHLGKPVSKMGRTVQQSWEAEELYQVGSRNHKGQYSGATSMVRDTSEPTRQISVEDFQSQAVLPRNMSVASLQDGEVLKNEYYYDGRPITPSMIDGESKAVEQVWIDPLKTLRHRKDIDFQSLQPHVDYKNLTQSKSQKKLIRQLSLDDMNHQAFWVHQQPKTIDSVRIDQQAEEHKQRFASNEQAKITHVRSYMMVKGKLIPSINYKAKTKIYNRFRVDDDQPRELITFPSKDGPLKLPNITTDNELNYDSVRTIQAQRKSTDARVSLTLDAPLSKRNLQTYITTLQMKQNLVDLSTKQAKTLAQASKPSLNNQNEDDPRELVDFIDEHKDLMEQFQRQVANVESYLQVAHIQKERFEEVINTFASVGSFYGGSDDYDSQEGQASPRQEAEAGQDEAMSVAQTKVETNDGVTAISPVKGSAIDLDAYSHVQTAMSITKGKSFNKPTTADLTKYPLAHQVQQSVKKVKSFFFGVDGDKKQTAETAQKTAKSGAIRENKPEVEVQADSNVPQLTSIEPVDDLQSTRTLLSKVDQRQLRSLVLSSQVEVKNRLQLEIEKMRGELKARYRDLVLKDTENRIKDNKRKIVELIVENIHTLKQTTTPTDPKPARKPLQDQMLAQVLKQRQQTYQKLQRIYNKAIDRNAELSQWMIHSTIITLMKKVRVLSDIVVLAQEKNLLDEFNGVKCKKVGVIEAELDFPLRVTEKYGSIEDNDYFTRRVRVQFDECLAGVRAAEEDLRDVEEARKQMIELVSEKVGHRAWVTVAAHRNLRRKQLKQLNEFDPSPDKIIPVPKLTRFGKSVVELPTAVKRIEAEIAHGGNDQFGTLERYAPAQLVSRPIKHQLYYKEHAISRALRKSSRLLQTTGKRAGPTDQQQRLISEYWDETYKVVTEGKRRPTMPYIKPSAKAIKPSQVNAKAAIEIHNETKKRAAKAIAKLRDQISAPGTPKAAQDDDALNGALNETNDKYNRDLNMMTNLQLKMKLNAEEKLREEEANNAKLQLDLQKAVRDRLDNFDDSPAKSSWLNRLAQEKIAKKAREEKEKADREAAMRKMIDDWDTNIDNFGTDGKGSEVADGDKTRLGEDLAGEGLMRYLGRIENHIKAEEKLIDAWNDKK